MNPANNPNFITNLLDRMDADPKLRKNVHELFRRGELSFLYHDTQLKMRELLDKSESDEILIFCSRQLGKSFFGVCEAIEFGIKNPKSIVRVFSHTIEQVQDIVNDNLRVIEQLAPPGFITRKKSDKRWQIGTSELRIGPLAAAHVDGKRGGNAGLIICEEGGFTPSDEYVDAIGSVIGPQLIRSGGRLIHITTPSKDVSHYIHTEVLPKCELKGALATYTVYDNPQLTSQQIERAKSKCPTPDMWEREYLCKIVKDPTAVIVPEFEENVHVCPLKPPPYTYYHTAIDFGGVRDNHALLLAYFDFQRNRYCILDEEFLEINTSTADIIQACYDMEKRNHVKWLNSVPSRVVDAPGQLHVDLKRAGLECVLPTKGKDSVEDGIQALRVAFLRGTIEIDPRCKNLIAALKYGMWDKNRKDFLRTPALGHCDMLAALSYSFRHINRRSNPFPPNLGLHKENHYFEREKQSDNETVLNEAFYGDDF